MKFYKILNDGTAVADIVGRHIHSIKSHQAQTSGSDIFALSFAHTPSYLQNPTPVPLIALICLQQNGEDFVVQAGVLRETVEHITYCKNANPDVESLKDYFALHQSPWLNLSAPLLLEPIYIPKPWGQEIWYTGIEERGQSRVSDSRFSVPLPWILELLPPQQPLTLLKILDPFPDENLGNLYFELHEQKQEVYIVTHVDEHAWPTGVGQIQMGFCQQKRKEFLSESDFKNAYLQVVSDYRQVRNLIDQSIDQMAGNADVDRGLLYQQYSATDVNKALIAQEQALRKTMNAFIYHHPLRVGDVVKVPCYTPHSLQHGVRVVEFQTPVYERKILSFGQKVLTQKTWDTEEAMGMAFMGAAPLESTELISSSQCHQLERIVNFDDFQVQRLVVVESFSVALTIESTTLIMLIAGNACFSDSSGNKRPINPGQAYMVVTGGQQQNLALEKNAILLVAMPNDTKWSEFG